MKLKGISDEGFRRLAQIVDEDENVSKGIDLDRLRELVEQAYSAMAASEKQLAPSDDQIISDHIREVVPLLKEMWNMVWDATHKY